MQRGIRGIQYSLGTVSMSIKIDGPVVQTDGLDNHDFMPTFDGICGLVMGSLLMLGRTMAELVDVDDSRGEEYTKGVQREFILTGNTGFGVTLEATMYCDAATVSRGELARNLETTLLELLGKILEEVCLYDAQRKRRAYETFMAFVAEDLPWQISSLPNPGIRRNPSWLVLALQRGARRLKSHWGAISD